MENKELYCFYCKEKIEEGQEYITVGDRTYHYSEDNPLDNCYFEEETEEE